MFAIRLNKEGIFNDPKWYNENPFAQSGYGLPNCTCYAWGRFYELLGTRPSLPLGNAGTWYQSCTAYEKGSEPRQGAIAVWAGGKYGHVAIVEKIDENGDITTSNSGYSRAHNRPHVNDRLFFWTEKHRKAEGYLSGWQKQRGYKLQGFIYLPEVKKETKKVKRYDRIEEVPVWARDTVQKLISKGALQGDGDNLNLSEEMLRLLVINDRMELYDKK